MGTIWIIGVCAVFIVPIGVATAIYLEEYADNSKWWNRLIEVNIQNLAAVPSIVYGILGLAFLVRGPLSLGRVVLAGGLTLGAARAAGRDHLRPRSDPRRAALDPRGLDGARRDAMADDLEAGAARIDPGIATGVILALSRAIGETAPLIVVGAATFITFNPSGLVGDGAGFSALPIQIFNWISQPQDEFQQLAAAGIVLLLGVLLIMNGVAIYLRNRYREQMVNSATTRWSPIT